MSTKRDVKAGMVVIGAMIFALPAFAQTNTNSGTMKPDQTDVEKGTNPGPATQAPTGRPGGAMGSGSMGSDRATTGAGPGANQAPGASGISRESGNDKPTRPSETPNPAGTSK